jgi:hypothetical protein
MVGPHQEEKSSVPLVRHRHLGLHRSDFRKNRTARFASAHRRIGDRLPLARLLKNDNSGPRKLPNEQIIAAGERLHALLCYR